MKNKILIGFAVLAIAAVAAWNVNLNAQKSDLSDIALANVEALAEETATDGELCYNTITTMKSSQVLFCGICKYILNSTASIFSGTGTCP